MIDYENEGYMQLAAAILKEAADEYIFALSHGKDEKRIEKLEKFFLSKWGQQLSNYHGTAIIRNCKRIAEEKKRDRNQRKK